MTRARTFLEVFQDDTDNQKYAPIVTLTKRGVGRFFRKTLSLGGHTYEIIGEVTFPNILTVAFYRDGEFWREEGRSVEQKQEDTHALFTVFREAGHFLRQVARGEQIRLIAFSAHADESERRISLYYRFAQKIAKEGQGRVHVSTHYPSIDFYIRLYVLSGYDPKVHPIHQYNPRLDLLLRSFGGK